MKLIPNLPLIKKFTRNLYLHFFVLGFLFCLLFYFSMESTYETELFNNISNKIKQDLGSNTSKDSFAIRALHMSYFLQERRDVVFGNQTFNSWKYNYIHPVTVDLMTAKGSCGSFALVLARVLKANGIAIRMGQMTVNGIQSGHVFIEAHTESGWIVLDPLYDLFFTKPGGKLAGYEDIHNNWAYYKTQVPAGYQPDYKYEDVRYTNWNKFSFVSRGIKKILDLTMGKTRADKISLRSHLLRVYNRLAWLSLLFFILTAWRTILVYRKKRRGIDNG